MFLSGFTIYIRGNKKCWAGICLSTIQRQIHQTNLPPDVGGGEGSCCSIFEVLCRSLIVLLSFFLAISLSFLLFTDSDYAFGILSSSYYRNKTLKTLKSHWISQLSCQVDLIDNSVTKHFSLFAYLKQLNNQMSSSAIIYVFKCDYMSHLYLYSCVPINSECPL